MHTKVRTSVEACIAAKYSSKVRADRCHTRWPRQAESAAALPCRRDGQVCASPAPNAAQRHLPDATEAYFGLESEEVEYWAARHQAAAGDSSQAAQQDAASAAAAGLTSLKLADGGSSAGSASAANGLSAGFASFQREPEGRKSYVLIPNAGGLRTLCITDN
jgi:hypothetical protein